METSNEVHCDGEKEGEAGRCGTATSEGQKEEASSVEEKRFMVYICGGYTDSAAERRAFTEAVSPRLLLFCKQRGYDFRMVDLRDGVETPAADRHDTAELHVENLKRCQQTPGPNFILFLGQKYEVRSLPSTISRDVFEDIVKLLEMDQQQNSKTKSAEGFTENSPDIPNHDSLHENHLNVEDEAENLSQSSGSSSSEAEDEEDFSLVDRKSLQDSKEDLALLRMWFRLDENCVPPVYRLQPISSHHPDCLSSDGERRRRAMKDWSVTCLSLWGIIHHRATEALGEEEAGQLLRTVLDQEVEAGLRSVGESQAEDHCHCYKRTITDLDSTMKNKHISEYADVLKGRSQLDPVLSRAQQQFMRRLHKKLRHTNIYERQFEGGQRGLDPKHNRSYQFYIDRVSSHFERTVISSINSMIKVSKTRGPFETVRKEVIRAQIQEEIQLHVRHRCNLAGGFTFRQTFIPHIKKALLQSRSRPILLLGPPGSGKSTTMATAAQLAPSWLKGDVKVLVHFCGFTGESRNIRLLLQSLCVQLVQTYRPNTGLSEGLPQLISEFHVLLGLATAERPLLVVLDGLDELSEDADLSWIAATLPPNVYFILSATADSPCTQTLQSIAPSMLSLPPLSPDEISAALETKLRCDCRRLQQHQFDLLLQACLSVPCPLYVETAYSETRLWTSYTSQTDLRLPHSLQGLYVSMLSRLETELGGQLVRRAASLISISRYGITEEELLDLLALDRKVVHEVALSFPSARKTPYVLWARLKHNLGFHLTEVRTDGTFVYRWTHSELGRVCMNRYSNTHDSCTAIHADFASYYSQKTERSLLFQPLAWTLEEEEEGGGVRKSYWFNQRKLRWLPYHLVHSGQIQMFLSECVFNYEFLLHKAWGLSVLDVEEDIKKAMLPETALVDLEVLAGALEMSRAVLLQDPCQLASQLLGRLGQMVTEDHPVAKAVRLNLGDPLKFSFLHVLLDQCRNSSLPVLLPSSTCLLPPGGLQHTLLAGHLTEVSAMGAGHRGSLVITSESNGTLRFWDLKRKRIIRSLNPVEGFVADSITLNLDDTMLIICMKQTLHVREVESGRVVYSEKDSIDVPMVTTTDEGRLLVVFYDGSDRVKVFDLSSSCSLLHCVHISMKYEAIHKDRSMLLSSNTIKDYVLFAHRSGGEAAVFSARKGAILSVLSAQLGGASIRAVETTEEYLLLFCRYPYKSGGDLLHVELFSSTSFLFLRSILGCSQDYISQVSVNREGTHIVAFCPSSHTGLTELITWDLETEHHKHISHLPAVLTSGVCLDLHLCVGFCRREKFLYLWDLSSRIRDQALTYSIHKPRRDGTKQLIPVGKNSRYAVSLSFRPGSVSVWNLSRRRFSCRPVRDQHGLYSSTDVVLIQDFRFYILTDRNTLSSRDRHTDRFQTLLVYDLIKKSYVRRKTGISVILCPQHEYQLLEDGQILLGLSETRDRVILWDLESGSIKHEIKPNVKETLDQQAEETLPREEKLTPKEQTEREKVREEERKKRVESEKYSSIEKYLLSGDQQVLVCSYFTLHLNVFSLASQNHLHTLRDQTSLLSLHTAAVTHTGSHLVLTHYSQEQRTPWITLWDLSTGMVSSRLKDEAAVCCIALTDDADRVVFGVFGSNSLKVWEPFKRSYKIICGYSNLRIHDSSELHLVEGGAKAVLLAGELSLWDVEACSVLSVLSPDAHISCMKLLHGPQVSVLLGFTHSPAVISVRSASGTISTKTQEPEDLDLFGESSSSEEEEDS